MCCNSLGDPKWADFKIDDYLAKRNFSINFSRILRITMTFPLRTIYLNSLDPSDEPECYDVDVVITYDNTQHDGQVVISLDSYGRRHHCNGNLNNPSDYKRTHELIALNVLVITLCSISFLLCFRSLYRAQVYCSLSPRT